MTIAIETPLARMARSTPWQRRFNASTVPVEPRFDEPVPAPFVDEQRERIPDFERARTRWPRH